MEENRKIVISSPIKRSSYILRRVYLLMMSALLVTTIVAFIVSRSNTLTSLLSANFIALIIIAVLEIVLVMVISSRIKTLSVPSALILFFSYAIINGLLFASIFNIYAGTNTIFLAFLCASITFGMAVLYSFITKRNIYGWGRWLLLGLISILIVSLINFFLNSTLLEYIVCIGGIFVFTLLSSWDSKKIIEINNGLGDSVTSEECTKIATLGALDLYLDFINILLYFIRLIGLSKNDK